MGVVVVRGGVVVDSFYSLIHPEPEYYQWFCQRVHGLGPCDTDDAPVFPFVWEKIAPRIEGLPLVAHNARFDLGFLQEGLARCGLPLWRGRTLDSLKLAKRCYPGLPSYRLQQLRNLLQLEDECGNDQPHRAGADVYWTMQVLKLSLERALAAGRR